MMGMAEWRFQTFLPQPVNARQCVFEIVVLPLEVTANVEQHARNDLHAVFSVFLYSSVVKLNEPPMHNDRTNGRQIQFTPRRRLNGERNSS